LQVIEFGQGSGRGGGAKRRAETGGARLECLMKAETDIVSQNDGAQESIAVTLLRLGDGECGGHDGAARVELAIRIVRFIRMTRHSVGKRGNDRRGFKIGP
jgi:hypothetical protein